MYDKGGYDLDSKADMSHRFSFWFILFTLLLSLTAPTSIVDGDSETVGVRILSEGGVQAQFSLNDNALRIDYGTFQWVVIPKADLPNLDAVGVTYQAFENPYNLNLGGETFDPLQFKPNFGDSWGVLTRESGPGLYLIQFQGPIKEIWLKMLNAEGLEILQYIHPFTYVVWGQPASLLRASQAWQVRWTGGFLPAYAVQPKNRTLNSDRIWFRAMTIPQAGLENIIQNFEALGAETITTASGVDPVFDLISFTLPGDQLENAASLPGVYSIQPIPTDGGDRGEMSNQVNVGNLDASNRAFPGYQAWLDQVGVDGDNVIIANVDSGIDETHPNLVNRMLECTGFSCGGSTLESDHGTHTAGIMAGDGSSGVVDSNGFLRGLGMAPGAKLIEQVYSVVEDLPTQMSLLMEESVKNGAVISGNSWGPSGTPQGYDLDTRLVDIGIRDADPKMPGNQPLTYVLSIMNGYGGISTQGTPDEAKNAFTIGSTLMQYADKSQNLNINDLSYNSAHGPALDGRLIPHMVSPGCYVDSTYMSSSYGLMCGTSMSSPHVSGAAALFYEKYRKQFGEDPSPALVKAAFLPVAHDLSGNRDADDGILGHPFDAKQGWGRMDAGAVLDPAMKVLYYDQEILLKDTGEFWGFTLNKPVNELRAMLVWTDAPGHGEGGSTPAWVNDLDLSITANGQTYYGNNFGSDGFSLTGGSPDFRNNTEGIFLQGSFTGKTTITVTGANIAGDGVPGVGDDTDQDFALVIYYSEIEYHHHRFFPIVFR